MTFMKDFVSASIIDRGYCIILNIFMAVDNMAVVIVIHIKAWLDFMVTLPFFDKIRNAYSYYC